MPPADDVREILDDCSSGMDQAISNFQRDLSKVRTGRANLSVLDNVRVDYYGTATPLNQVAALTVADPRLIAVKPWDKNLIGDIEKSVLASIKGSSRAISEPITLHAISAIV